MATTDDYARQLAQLMPRGPAWSRDPKSILGRLRAGMAVEFSRIHARLNDLLREARPQEALETLDTWEADYGLPDECTGRPDNIAERQAALWSKITAASGQSRDDFKAMAAALGYVVEIEEFRPFDTTRAAGDELFSDDWRFAWQFNVVSADPEVTARFKFFAEFNIGGDVGSYLVGWGALDLECVISRAAPGHLATLFGYIPDPEPVFVFDFIKGLS